VALVAPYLLGALAVIFGAVLQGLGAVASFAGNLIGNFVPVVGGVLRAAGAILSAVGRGLVSAGNALMKTANNFYAKLKEGGFSAVKDSLQSGIKNFINRINPLTAYKEAYTSVTKTLHDFGVKSGLSKLIEMNLVKVGFQIAQAKIDQSLEKNKAGVFLSAVLSTVSSAGIQGIGSAIASGASNILNRIAASIGLRAPPTNGPKILRYPGDEAYYLYGQDGKSGGIIFGGKPVDFGIPSGQGPADAYGYKTDENGIPLFAYRLGGGEIGGGPQTEIEVQRNPDGVSFTGDNATRFESRRDPSTGRYRAPERVGNIESSFVERLRGLADRTDIFLDATTDTAIDFLGPVGISPASTQIFLGRENAKGIVDTFRLGDPWTGIRSKPGARLPGEVSRWSIFISPQL
jgi:hypothetical protein